MSELQSVMLTEVAGGVLLYFGLISAALGTVSLVRPLRFRGLCTRRRGLAALLVGFLAFVAGVCLPARERRVAVNLSRLDEFAPVYQFSEFHSIPVHASRDRIYAAIHAVRPEEIRFLRTLMRIRALKPPPNHRPILDTFTSGWFIPLADDPRGEIVFGRAARTGKSLPAEQFNGVQNAPFLKIAMNFAIVEVAPTECVVTTETRVYAVGGDMRRGFATYWRMIRPGSALIRRMWLRAIRNRAEAATT